MKVSLWHLKRVKATSLKVWYLSLYPVMMYSLSGLQAEHKTAPYCDRHEKKSFSVL